MDAFLEAFADARLAAERRSCCESPKDYAARVTNLYHSRAIRVVLNVICIDHGTTLKDVEDRWAQRLEGDFEAVSDEPCHATRLVHNAVACCYDWVTNKFPIVTIVSIVAAITGEAMLLVGRIGLAASHPLVSYYPYFR